MSDKSITDRVSDLLIAIMSLDEAPSLTDTFEDIGLDSLDEADFILALDVEFSVEIPHVAAAQWLTAADAIDWLTANGAK